MTCFEAFSKGVLSRAELKGGGKNWEEIGKKGDRGGERFWEKGVISK